MLTTRSKIKLAHLAQRPLVALRKVLGKDHITEVTRGGIRWRLDLDEGIDFSIYLLGAFEPRTVRTYARFVRPGATVLDIGANIGAHTLPLARLVGPAGRVFAFEPTDFAFSKLEANMGLNPELVPRIEATRIFLVDRLDASVPETIPSSWPLDPKGDVHPKLRGRAMPATHARATTLDAFLDEARVGRVDFIKLDVDGFECSVLRGAAQTLRRCRPIIITELSPFVLEERGESADALIGLFEEAGYVLVDMSSGAPIPVDRVRGGLIADGAGLNVIARPRGSQ